MVKSNATLKAYLKHSFISQSPLTPALKRNTAMPQPSPSLLGKRHGGRGEVSDNRETPPPSCACQTALAV